MNERSVCPDCFDGFHSGCIGNGCYCDCTLEDDDPDVEDEDDGDYCEMCTEERPCECDQQLQGELEDEREDDEMD